MTPRSPSVQTSRIIALRFGFKPGPSYSHAAISHVKERLEGLKNLKDVHYADERFFHAWDN